MSKVEVTYTGNQQCVAIDTKNGKRVASDCSMTKGEEFGPEGLVAAGLGSCMLIAMSSFAERHGLDVAGARVDVNTSLGGKPEIRISTLNVTVRVPRTFTEEEQTGLKKAAEACPIKHSFRPDTEISTHFEFGDS
jgi:putative redox protein